MNLKEGTRRLALLLGALGAILGGFAAYSELQTVLSQRARHIKFEQLAASNVVKQERNCRLLGYSPECSKIKLPPGATLVEPEKGKYTDAKVSELSSPKFDPLAPYQDPAKDAIDRFIELPKEERERLFEQLAPEKQHKLLDAIKKRKQANLHGKSDPYAATAEPDDWTDVSDEPAKFNMEFATPIPSEVNVEEIKTITWTMGKDYGVESIVTTDGQTIYPTPAPVAWLYLLIALFPIFGFFIPWGVVRAVGWVVAGFIQGPK